MILGLLKPTKGKVLINGIEIEKQREEEEGKKTHSPPPPQVIESSSTTRSEKIVLNCFRIYLKKLLRCFKKKKSKTINQ